MKKPSQPNSRDYFKQVGDASSEAKPALFVQFCHAAISERERGELELYEVGNQMVSLTGSMLPHLTGLHDKLNPTEKLLDELHGLAGRLDMAGQGGSTPKDDEELWQRFKQLVDEYEASLEL